MRKGLAAVAVAGTVVAVAGFVGLRALDSGKASVPRHFEVVAEASSASLVGSGHLYAEIVRPTVLWGLPGAEPLVRLTTRTEFHSARVLPVVQRRGQWLGVIATQVRNGQIGWISERDVRLGRQPYSIAIDLSRRELALTKGRQVVQRVPVAIGQASTPTPTGRFAVTDTLRVKDRDSPYGCCAIALSAHQPEIPQGWGGGDRIAVHATTNELSIGRAVSYGCLRASQSYMRKLIRRIPLGTPVRITA